MREKRGRHEGHGSRNGGRTCWSLVTCLLDLPCLLHATVREKLGRTGCVCSAAFDNERGEEREGHERNEGLLFCLVNQGHQACSLPRSGQIYMGWFGEGAMLHVGMMRTKTRFVRLSPHTAEVRWDLAWQRIARGNMLLALVGSLPHTRIGDQRAAVLRRLSRASQGESDTRDIDDDE